MGRARYHSRMVRVPTETPPAGARRATMAFIFVTAVLDVVALGIIIPVLPALIAQFAGGEERGGIMNGVFVALWAAMQFAASPVIGSVSDRFGRRPVILLSAAGLAADYVLMALAPNLWWLALGRIIAGITTAPEPRPGAARPQLVRLEDIG